MTELESTAAATYLYEVKQIQASMQEARDSIGDIDQFCQNVKHLAAWIKEVVGSGLQSNYRRRLGSGLALKLMELIADSKFVLSPDHQTHHHHHPSNTNNFITSLLFCGCCCKKKEYSAPPNEKKTHGMKMKMKEEIGLDTQLQDFFQEFDELQLQSQIKDTRDLLKDLVKQHQASLHYVLPTEEMDNLLRIHKLSASYQILERVKHIERCFLYLDLSNQNMLRTNLIQLRATRMRLTNHYQMKFMKLVDEFIQLRADIVSEDQKHMQRRDMILTGAMPTEGGLVSDEDVESLQIQIHLLKLRIHLHSQICDMPVKIEFDEEETHHHHHHHLLPAAEKKKKKKSRCCCCCCCKKKNKSHY